MQLKTTTAAAALALAISSVPALAATVDFGPLADPNDPADPINTSLAISTAATTLTSFELFYQGDLGQSGETLEVFVEGTSIGTVGPDLMSTGAFGTPTFLIPGTDNANIDPLTATATLSLDISGLVGDGFLELSFVPSSTVNNFGTQQVGQGIFQGLNSFSFAVAGTLEFDVSNTAPVPLPASLPLLAGGVFVMGALKRRKRKAA